jgi:ferric-dicitrate binding protein FerR (iron transport regulator)
VEKKNEKMKKDITYQKVKQAATYADLTPQIAVQLKNMFLHLEDENKPNDIDEWMHASTANENLFDLLCVVNREGTGAPYMEMLVRMAKKRANPLYQYRKTVLVGLIVILIILVLDFIIPAHPLSRLVYGDHPADRTLDQTTVTTAAEGRTIWLDDSTRIDLGPHSMARYPNELSWSTRKLKITGTATVTVRGSVDQPFRLVAGEYKFETYKDAVIRYENDKLTVEALHP